MNSKKSNNRKSGNSLKKNERKSNCQAKATLKKSTNNGRAKKILPDHEPYVWQWLAEGRTYEKTANLLKEKFGVVISMNGVYDYQRRHWSDWEIYLGKIKEVRLANAKSRILERQRMTNKLRDKIFELMDFSPIEWKDINLHSLIKEYNSLLDKIQEDSGDKRKEKEGEQEHQHIIQIFNTIPGMFADGNSGDTGKETATTGRGLRMDRI